MHVGANSNSSEYAKFPKFGSKVGAISRLKKEGIKPICVVFVKDIWVGLYG